MKLTLDVSDGIYKILQIHAILDDTTPEKAAIWVLQDHLASKLEVDEVYADWIKTVTKIKRPDEEMEDVKLP